MYSIRENALYMLSFEKLLEENPAGDYDDDDIHNDFDEQNELM